MDEGYPYDKTPSTNPSSSLSPSTSPLTIEKPIPDTILIPPKTTIHKSVFNTSARASQFYNIVEDMAQAYHYVHFGSNPNLSFSM